MTLKRKANGIFYYKVIKRLDDDMSKYGQLNPDWDTLAILEITSGLPGHKTYVLSLGIYYEGHPISEISFSETFKTKADYCGKWELKKDLEFMFNKLVEERCKI